MKTVKPKTSTYLYSITFFRCENFGSQPLMSTSQTRLGRSDSVKALLVFDKLRDLEKHTLV